MNCNHEDSSFVSSSFSENGKWDITTKCNTCKVIYIMKDCVLETVESSYEEGVIEEVPCEFTVVEVPALKIGKINRNNELYKDCDIVYPSEDVSGEITFTVKRSVAWEDNLLNVLGKGKNNGNT